MDHMSYSQSLVRVYSHLVVLNSDPFARITQDLGMPSQIHDDWVSVQACAAVGMSERPAWLAGIPDTSLQSLCITRQAGQVAQILGGSIHSPSGQLEGLSTHAIWSNLNTQLDDLQQRLVNMPTHLSVLMHMARYRLSCFGLQIVNNPTARPQIVVQLYTSCVRAFELAESRENGDWKWWPRSIYGSICPASVNFPVPPRYVCD